ncbi:MAG: 50S ribosomal protein L33 [Elusimicrobia bacterium]|nr:50S ribosomal protein L33 [Elusimicrobiota bacterium]
MPVAERVIVTLACSECKRRNYHFARGKKKEFKLELKKFCRACGHQTLHRETK